MNELLRKTIAELAELIAAKELSPVEITQALLEHIDTYDGKLRSYITVFADDAIAQAQKAEQAIVRGDYQGTLHGIPIAIKDNIFTKNTRTTMGSKIHQDFIPSYDATVVRRLKEAGAIVIGKTNLHEYAMGITTENPHHGICKNPWNLEHGPGGSSGGSGAAVAAHMAPAALGTDTAGSIRIPASACGIVGLKPSYGRVSKYGVYPEAWSLDHVGPMTKSVLDAAIILSAIEGFDANDPAAQKMPAIDVNRLASCNTKKIVVGFEENFFFKHSEPQIVAAVQKALRHFEALGVTVKTVQLPTLEHAEFSLMMTDLAEVATLHHENLRTKGDEFGTDVRQTLELGELVSAVDYLQAQQVRAQLKREFAAAFKEIDVFVAPTLAILPNKIGETKVTTFGKDEELYEVYLRLTGTFNLTGLPALSLPVAFISGLPVGMQLVGGPFADEKLLQIAHQFETTYPLDRNGAKLFCE